MAFDKKYLYIGAGVVVLCAASFGAGRFSKPAEVREVVKYQDKIVEKVVTVEVEKRVVVKGPVRVVVRTVEKPTGEKVTEREITRGETTVTVEAKTDTTADKAEEKVGSSEKVTKNEYPRLTLGAGVATNWNDWKVSYSFLAGYRLTGPLGVWANVTTAGSMSLGVSIVF